MPVEARNRRPKPSIGCDSSDRKQPKSLFDLNKAIPVGLYAILSRIYAEKRQHVDQFKAPADIRRATRPAELIALRALARCGVSELARSRGLFKPAS